MSKQYIGVKIITAEPMKLSEFAEANNHMLNPDTADQDGYLVIYPDGYRSWSPKEIFEGAYMPLENGTAITKNDINVFVGDNGYMSDILDEKTSLVKCTTRTGFVLYDTSSCVSPKNFSHDIGCKICVNNITDKLWGYLGFVLQWGLNGLNKPKNDSTIESDVPMTDVSQTPQ